MMQTIMHTAVPGVVRTISGVMYAYPPPHIKWGYTRMIIARDLEIDTVRR